MHNHVAVQCGYIRPEVEVAMFGGELGVGQREHREGVWQSQNRRGKRGTGRRQ